MSADQGNTPNQQERVPEATPQGSPYTDAGTVTPGSFIEVYIPAWDSVLDFRVKAQRNDGFPHLDLGAIPVSVDGTSYGATVPAGTTSDAYRFPWPDNRPSNQRTRNDAFYFEASNTLIQARIDIKPILLHNFINYPEGTPQLRYSNGNVTNQPSGDDVFGYWQRAHDFVFLPKMNDLKFLTENPTNVDISSAVEINYAEYEVELITDMELMKRIWLQDVPRARFTLPIYSTIERTFRKTIESYQDFTIQDLSEGRFHVPYFMEHAGAI